MSDDRHLAALQLVLRRLDRIREEGVPLSVGVKIGHLQKEIGETLDLARTPRPASLVEVFQTLDSIVQNLGDSALTSIIRWCDERLKVEPLQERSEQ